MGDVCSERQGLAALWTANPHGARQPRMSFDLTILATALDASDDEIRVQALQCAAWLDHPEGDLDERIVAFYETLREDSSAEIPRI